MAYQLSKNFIQRYGPWAVVTGASDGIGKEAARVLAENGLNLVLCARREPALQALATELIANHAIQCRVVAVNLATAGGNAQLMDAVRDLDVGLLVAAAGIGTSGDFIEGDFAQEEQMLMLNCAGVLHQSSLFAQKLVARGSGGIVLVSSMLAFMGTPRAAHYAATKAYVQSLAEGLHEELKPLGIDVLASAPGPTASGFADRANLRMPFALSSRVVASRTLSALGKRGTVRPGGLSKLLGWSLATAPRWLRVKIIGVVMRGMTAHHDQRQVSAGGVP